MRRARLTISVALYGGAVGAAALFVSLLAQVRFPNEPEHMALLASVFLGSGGALAGGALAALITYSVGQKADKARHLLAWEALGFGYGVLLPFFTGMLIPLSGVFLNLAVGVITAGEVFSQVVDAISRSPAFAFSQGTFGLFTGMLAGLLLGTGAWLIDTANAEPNARVSGYGPWAIAAVLSIGVVAVAAFGPPPTLAKLG